MRKKRKSAKKFLQIISLVGGIILILIAISIFIFETNYQNKIYPRIKIGDVDVSGQTFMETLEMLEKPLSEINTKGLKFKYQEEKITVEPTVASAEDVDLNIEILKLPDYNQLINEVYSIGRQGNWLERTKTKIKNIIFGQQKELGYLLNEEELKNILKANFAEFEKPAQNAQLVFTNGQPNVLAEKNGKIFNYDNVIIDLKNNLNNLNNRTIELQLVDDYPKIKMEDTEPLLEAALKVADLAPIKLQYGEKSWEISKEGLQDWLDFKVGGVKFNKNLEDYLKNLAEEINVEAKEGKFKVKEDKTLEQIQTSQEGKELNIEKSIEELNKKIIEQKKREVELVVEVSKPKFTPENLANEIKELLGTGQTNFAGSSWNRVKNIEHGADILNGLLIAPGEEFSLVNALGEIDGEHGWLPGLVIKGDKTVPEYGGGLCQIGSTFFRAVMNSGLPITERQNHSYTVSYYFYNGKAGVDATIYGPHPDFRFLNDTDHWLLLQTRIEGTDLYFDLWGTSDGRKGYFTTPINYNWVDPGPTKYIETEELAPGEEKCTEVAHKGVTAEFDYIIEKANGEKITRTFKSIYKPWPAVCLKGKEKGSS